MFITKVIVVVAKLGYYYIGYSIRYSKTGRFLVASSSSYRGNYSGKIEVNDRLCWGSCGGVFGLMSTALG